MITTAKIIEDSVNDHEQRLTTIEVTLHRFVLAEFNTHRVFSRNSASSRAIPVEKQLQRIKENTAFPIAWPAEQPGMQGGAELDEVDRLTAMQVYADTRNLVVRQVEEYLETHPKKEHRLHKSVLNRLLEPYMWHTIVVSSTDWDNFWGLRCSPLAQPEIRVAAEAMKAAYDASTPDYVPKGDWHLPYITRADWSSGARTSQLKKVSVARCARVSSLHAGEAGDYEKDYRLYDMLTSADPPHASPLEHVATPVRKSEKPKGNFVGWHQLRHLEGK